MGIHRELNPYLLRDSKMGVVHGNSTGNLYTIEYHGSVPPKNLHVLGGCDTHILRASKTFIFHGHLGSKGINIHGCNKILFLQELGQG